MLRLAAVLATVLVASGCKLGMADFGTHCVAVAQAAPAGATIHVTQSIVVAATLDAACPIPLLENETPAVIRMDTLGLATVRVTGIVPGSGRVRVKSGVDPSVSVVSTIDVIP